jgi:hypothetical protein
MTEAYPLQWSEGWPRTAPTARDSEHRSQLTVAQTVYLMSSYCVGARDFQRFQSVRSTTRQLKMLEKSR